MADISAIKYRLGELGYMFFETGEEIAIESLIIDLMKSGEKRYMKAIPFLIFQSYDDPGKKPRFDLEKLHQQVKENDLEKEVNAILYVAMEIFRASGDRADMIKSISSYLKKHSPEKEKRIFEMLFKNKTAPADPGFEAYAKNKMINWLDIEEMSDDFLMHKRLKEMQDKLTLKERLDVSGSRSMMIRLSEIFTPRQRGIIQKIIDEKPLGKTEYEYYIRIIKKRLDAIAELRELADAVAKKKPKRISGQKAD